MVRRESILWRSVRIIRWGAVLFQLRVLGGVFKDLDSRMC